MLHMKIAQSKGSGADATMQKQAIILKKYLAAAKSEEVRFLTGTLSQNLRAPDINSKCSCEIDGVTPPSNMPIATPMALLIL